MSVDRRFALLRHDHGFGDPEPISLSSVADGDILQYDSATGKFVNLGFPASPASGDMLLFDGTDWVSRPANNGTNLIRNGGFDIWQFGTSFTSLSASTNVIADRWYYICNGAGVATCGRGSTYNADLGGSQYHMECAPTTVDSSIAAGDYYYFEYRMEGVECLGLALGQAEARTVTLSFSHLHTVTGTYCVSFVNSTNSRAYVAEYTHSAADTWERSTVTLTLCTDGTWLTSAGAIGLKIRWAIAAGSTYQTTADSWQTGGGFLATSNQANGMSSTSNDNRIAAVKLEIGSYATPFEKEDFNATLANAQRYRCSNFPNETVPADGAINVAGPPTTAYATTQSRAMVQFPVKMCKNPTITFYQPITGATAGVWAYYLGGWTDGTSMGTANISTLGFWAQVNDSGAGFTAGNSYITYGPYKAVATL